MVAVKTKKLKYVRTYLLYIHAYVLFLLDLYVYKFKYSLFAFCTEYMVHLMSLVTSHI